MQVNSNCANNSMLDSFGLFAAFRHRIDTGPEVSLRRCFVTFVRNFVLT
jgi:hypothetical protein